MEDARGSALEGVESELRDWLEALRIALGGERASLYATDGDADQIRLALHTPEGVGRAADRIPIQGHALGWVVTEGVSLRASRPDVLRDAEEGWLIAAPAADRRGERIACVLLEFRAAPPPDATRALELAGRLAGRLIGDARGAQAAVAEAEKTGALYDAVEGLDRELDLDGLARDACRRARAVAGASGAVLAAWDAERTSGRILAVDGTPAPALVGEEIAGDDSFLSLALRNATVLPRDDLKRRGRYPLYVADGPSDAGSAIIAPVLIDGRPIGGLAVEFAARRGFSEGDVLRLKTLARYLGPSLRNAFEFGAVRARSLTDPLTGLPNRRSTERALASAIAVAERSGGAYAVALLDIDHFKQVNDRYGHDVGDQVLRTIGRVIRDSLRPGDHAGRWGGEEFLVVLPSTGIEDAGAVVERIRRGVERTEMTRPDGTLAVTLSAGVSAFPDSVAAADDVVSSADAALYRAKRSGRNAVVRA